jgi:hypothetical protein
MHGNATKMYHYLTLHLTIGACGPSVLLNHPQA